jgi:MFS family permease
VSLRQPAFRLYTANRVFAALGNSLLQALMAWQVYQISGSALDLGLLGLVRFVPAFAMSLIGGAVADAYDRRSVMVVSQIIPFVCAAVLAVATFGDWASLNLIFGLVLLIGFASAFEGPARQALLPAIVPSAHFANAVTVSTTLQKLGNVTGPTLAGAIIATAGTATGYAVFCASVIGSVLPLVFIHLSASAVARRRVSVAAVKEGVAFVRNNQVLLGAMSLDMFAVMFGGAAALLPIYATDILDSGSLGFGLLTSSLQIGAFLTSFVMVWRPPVTKTGKTLIYTVVVYGLATIAFGLSREFALSLFLYGLIGAADQVSVVMRQTTIQTATPDELRGRVSAVNQVFFGASGQIGAMESGFAAAATSATFAVVSGGAVAVGVASFMGWRLKQLFNYVVPVSEPPAMTPPAAKPATEMLAEQPAVSGGS